MGPTPPLASGLFARVKATANSAVAGPNCVTGPSPANSCSAIGSLLLR
jgi:hypothetical protein